MRNSIVEGEPGMFPDPIARLLVRLGRIARKKDRTQPPPVPPAGEGDPATGSRGPDDDSGPAAA